MKERLFGKIVCLLLVLATLLSTLPMSVFAEEIGGAEVQERYIKEIKLAQAGSKTEARCILEGEGYIFLDRNLNEGTGADGIWIGYITTTDPTEAIYNMKLINTDGGYTLTSMAAALSSQKDNFSQMAADLNCLIEEFVQAYKAGSIPAQKAYMALNFFRVVDGETELVEQNGLGYQLVHGNMSIEKITNMILFCDATIFDSVVKILTMGIQGRTENWMEQLSEVGVYDKEESYGDDEAELKRRAKQLLTVLQLYAQTYNTLDAMGLVSGKFNEQGQIENNNSDSGESGGGGTDAVSAQKADLAKVDLERLESYKLVFDELDTYKYGTGTLKDFFCSLETQKSEKVLYPLVSVLSDGEFSALSYGCFMEVALGAGVKSSDFEAYDDAYAEVTKDAQSVYLYAGVNPVLLEDDTVIGFTDTASRHMALTSEYQFYEKESWGEDVWENGRYSAYLIGSLGAAVMCASKLTLGVMSWFGVLAAASAKGASVYLAGTVKAITFLGSGYVTLITLAIAATVALISYIIYAVDKAINGSVDWEANPIPEYMYDVQEVGFTEVSENEGIATDYIKRPVFIFYEAVCDIYGKTVDLNARSKDSTQWISLYVSYDRPGDSSRPIKADDLLVRTGNGETPEGYTPVARFGEVRAYNLNQWDEDDDVNGIYMFYQQDQEIAVESDRNYYIHDVYLQTGESPTHCISLLEAAGYTPLNVNLSPDYTEGLFTSTPVYTYLGYTVTNNPSDAITDLRIEYGANQGQIQIGNIVYAGSGSSAGVTLYATKHKAAGTPLLAGGLICVDNRNDAPAGYEPVNFFAGGPAASFSLSTDGITIGMKDYFIYFLPQTTFTSGDTYLGGVSYYYCSDMALTESYERDSNGKSVVSYMKDMTGKDYPTTTQAEIRKLMSDYAFTRAGYHVSTSENGEYSDSVVYYKTHNPYRAIYGIKATETKDMPDSVTYDSLGYTLWNITWWSGGAYADSAQSIRYLFCFSYNGQGKPNALTMSAKLYVMGNPAKDNVYDTQKKAMSKIQPIKLSDLVCLKKGDDASGVGGADSAYVAVKDLFSNSSDPVVMKQKNAKNEFTFYVVENVTAKPYVSGVFAMDKLSIFRAAGGTDAGLLRENITNGMLLSQLARQGATNFADINVSMYSESFWGDLADDTGLGTWLNEMNTLKFGYKRTDDGSLALRDMFIYFNGFSVDDPPSTLYRGTVKYTLICEIPYNLTGYEDAPQPGVYLYGTTDKKAGNRIIDIEFSDTPFKDGYLTVRTRNGRSMWAEINDYIENQKNGHFMSGAQTLFKKLFAFFGFEGTNYGIDGKRANHQYFYIHIKREGDDIRTQKTYISELYLATDRDSEALAALQVKGIMDDLFDQGAEAYLNVDLNEYAWGSRVYLGYSYTADPNDAITDIRASHKVKLDHPTVDDVSYELVGDINLNQGNKGTAIYLYCAKSHAENVGTPITAIRAQRNEAPRHNVTDTAEILPVMRWDSQNASDLNDGYGKSPLYLTVVRPFDCEKGSYKAPNYGSDKVTTRLQVTGEETGKYIAALYVMDKNTIRQEKLAAGVASDQCTCDKITDQEVFDRLAQMGATTILTTPIQISGEEYGKSNPNKVFIGYSRTDDDSMAIRDIVIKAELLSQSEPRETIEIKNDMYTLVAEAAKKVTSLPRAINLIGTEDGQDLLIPRFYLYTSTFSGGEPICDISIDGNHLKNGWVTVRSDNGQNPFADIYEAALKQAELGEKDDDDSYDNDLVYSDELYKWMYDIADMFDPEDQEVAPFFIHCKKFDGDSIETALPYIGEIFIAEGDSKNEALSKLIAFAPDGYIDCDLNEKAGGNYVYMAYKRTDAKSEAITDLAIFTGKNPAESKRFNSSDGTSVRYDLVANVDLNSKAGGDYLYLYATTNKAAGEPILSLWISHDTVSRTADGFIDSTVKRANSSGFTKEDPDLNNGAGGSYLYLIARRAIPAEKDSDWPATLFGSGSFIAICVLAGIGVMVAVIVCVKKRKARNSGDGANE